MDTDTATDFESWFGNLRAAVNADPNFWNELLDDAREDLRQSAEIVPFVPNRRAAAPKDAAGSAEVIDIWRAVRH